MKKFILRHEGIPSLAALESVQRHKSNRLALLSKCASMVFLAVLALAVAPSAFAVCVPTEKVACLADQPIQSAVSVKPNIMFILDNSGSMDWDFMPDSAGYNTDCRKNYHYNTIYYNPNFNYTASVPKNAMKVSMGSQSFDNAKEDPFATTFTYTNLSEKFKAYSGDKAGPAYYAKYIGGGSPGTKCLDNVDKVSKKANYELVVVGANSCVVGGDITSCPTGADERENFANWYSYNRTRLLMMKSAMATAFSTIDENFRVGFYTINFASDPTFNKGAAMNIKDFSGGEPNTPKGDWYARLFKVKANNTTPLQTALTAIGKYFSGTPPSGLSGDPVQYSCQKNFTILSTDGGWNGEDTKLGDWDDKVPKSMPIKEGASSYKISDTGLTPNELFPRPFYEGPKANNDTLADVAMHYWITDLRTTGEVSANNVPSTPADPAYWQHMSTFTVGLGLDGSLAYPTDYAALVEGSKNWPVTPNGGDQDTSDISKFDDLWHAAVNGHGQYYKATNPTTLANSLNYALKAITDAPTYGVGPSSATNDYQSPDQTDHSTYSTSYRPINWSGDAKKYQVNTVTGFKIEPPLWSASYQLDSQVNPGLTPKVSTTAYTSRNIVTRNGAKAIPFTWSTLSTDQQTALCYKVSPGAGACVADDPSLVNYLRGDPTYEGDYGVGTSRFRNRHDAAITAYHKRDLLGSFVNAKPKYVAAENRSYQDPTDPGYSDFQKKTKARKATLYAAANDGMLHAFDAATGNELWAYIPSFLITTANDENGKEKGLRALSYQDGGAPPYNQHFYIDGTPEIGAVDFSRTAGVPKQPPLEPDWHTILVGGLGKGGKGYYALDVTIPADGLDNAQTKVLWEFPSASDASHSAVITGGQMGYSYGTPFIAKTAAFGWVVMVSSGYNNTDGYGYVFVLDAKKGTLLETLKTTALAPGMAHITTLTDFTNKYVNQVYSGDLNGNLWRFDFNQNPLINQITKLPQRVWPIFSSSTTTPIGSEVDVEVDGNTGHRWVFFGTGLYLDASDRLTENTQYLVALRDGDAALPDVSGSAVATLGKLTSVTDLKSGVTDPTSGLSYEPAIGWKYQLPNITSKDPAIPTTLGQRVVIKPVADLRTVIFTSLIPTNAICSPGTNAYVYGLEYSTGASRLKEDGKTIASKHFSGGVSGITFQQTGKSSAPASSGSPQAKIALPDGTEVGIELDTTKLNSSTRHVGWRELAEEH